MLILIMPSFAAPLTCDDVRKLLQQDIPDEFIINTINRESVRAEDVTCIQGLGLTPDQMAAVSAHALDPAQRADAITKPIELPSTTSSTKGKLGAGWRGHPYGDGTWLVKPPGLHCKAKPEHGVSWTCWETIGEGEYDVSYLVEEGIYTGVVINCKTFSSCENLYITLGVAWGGCSTDEYASGLLPNGTFNSGSQDNGVFGTWNYNQYSGKGSAIAQSLELAQQVQSIKEERAKKTVEDL